jgi:DNA polymerase III subunit beta
MSYEIQKNELLDLLQKAYPVVPSKSSLQMLSNVKIAVKNGTIEISATDLDHFISVRGQVSGKGEAELAVNARKLFEVVRELHEGTVTIDFDEKILILESGDSFICKIAGADVQDFPIFPEVADKKEFQISFNNFKDMVQKTTFAVSKDETRACLCGVLWEIAKNKAEMVATDGHRLGSCSYESEIAVKEKMNCIVSPKSLLHLVHILGQEGNDIAMKISLGEKYIVFANDTITLCSKLIEGPYPDYEKVIPKNNTKKPIVDRILLQDAVRRVSVLSNQKTHLVKFIFRPSQLEIIVLNRDIGGEARQSIPIEYSGDEHIIGFNAAYLAEILNIVSTPTVRMEMSTQISACLLIPVQPAEAKSKDIFLIMPLRIMEEL